MNKYYEEVKDLPQYNLNQAFFQACKDGNLEKVRYLLHSKELPLNVDVNVQEGSALIAACQYAQHEVIKYLLTSSELKNTINVNVQEGMALVYACENNDVELVRYLLTSPELKEHANMHCKGDFHLGGDRPFLLACISESSDVLEYLISEFYIDKTKEIEKIIEQGDYEILPMVENLFKMRDLHHELTNNLPKNNDSNRKNKL